jgi:hypothetical protein
MKNIFLPFFFNSSVSSYLALVRDARAAPRRLLRSLTSCNFIIATKNIFLLSSIIIYCNSAYANVITFSAIINTKNPCSNEMLTIHGITTLSINETAKGVFISQNFTGVENGYSVNYNGNANFDEVQKTYEFETNGEWKSGSNSFISKAKDRVFSDNGTKPKAIFL